MGTVKYLLDTHTFLWALRGSSKLSEKAAKTIEDMNVQIYLSAVSAYEIKNKHRMGKLPDFDDIAKDYFNFVEILNVLTLPISEKHAHFASSFDWSHRDPFDRMLAAQASIENLTLITNDEAFNSLPWINVLW
ncbi:MAG: type II toxin-antitoxin system VapC family toxin [Oscillospiraceae bacterium]|nr:type II toxin-antitoxin system VapC family toxin [Oscillospiraceae bacterium]